MLNPMEKLYSHVKNNFSFQVLPEIVKSKLNNHLNYPKRRYEFSC